MGRRTRRSKRTVFGPKLQSVMLGSAGVLPAASECLVIYFSYALVFKNKKNNSLAIHYTVDGTSAFKVMDAPHLSPGEISKYIACPRVRANQVRENNQFGARCLVPRQ